MMIVPCATAAVVCALVVGSARPQPMRNPIEGLEQCIGLPCYWGVVPGYTDWDDILAQFAGRVIKKTENEITALAGNTTQTTVYFWRVENTSTVSSFEIQFYNAGPRLGDIVAAYGAPCFVAQPQANLSIVGVAYPYMIAFASVDLESSYGKFVNSRSSVNRLWITSSPVYQMSKGWEGGWSALPWLGFTTLRHYGFER
jgi:hypothetical protein